MSRHGKRAIKWTTVVAVGLLAVAAGFVAQAPIAAQDHGANGPVIEPTGVGTLIPETRSVQSAAAKATTAGQGSGEPAQRPSAEPSAAAPPALQFVNFEGIAASEAMDNNFAFAPSDSHGAVGHTQYMEGTNDAFRVFTKGTTIAQPTIVVTLPFRTFFNTTELNAANLLNVLRPRVLYDARWRRYIAVATRHSVNASDPLKQFYLAVSKGTTADGSWCVYKVNFSGATIANGDWWDFPQLGMDLDTLIITGTVRNNIDALRTTAMMPIAKAQVYNCLSSAAPLFTGLQGPLTPPIVRDQSGTAHLIAANNGCVLCTGGVVVKYALTNSSRRGITPATLTGPVTVTGVTLWVNPPLASQPGTALLLSTDSGFVNASTQVGNSLFNAHAVASDDGSFSRIRWYRIGTDTASVFEIGTIPAATASTHDFNPSIAANDALTTFVVYSSSSSTVNPQIRFGGKAFADVSIPLGTLLFTSPVAMTTNCGSVCKWGNYSAVSIDPSQTTKAWIVNQYSKTGSMLGWGTRIARIGS